MPVFMGNKCRLSLTLQWHLGAIYCINLMITNKKQDYMNYHPLLHPMIQIDVRRITNLNQTNQFFWGMPFASNTT